MSRSPSRSSAIQDAWTTCVALCARAWQHRHCATRGLSPAKWKRRFAQCGSSGAKPLDRYSWLRPTELLRPRTSGMVAPSKGGHVCKLGLEDNGLKRKDSPCHSGRSSDWFTGSDARIEGTMGEEETAMTGKKRIMIYGP